MDYLRWELDGQVKFILMDLILGVEIEPSGLRTIMARGMSLAFTVLNDQDVEIGRAVIAIKTRAEMVAELTAS